MVKCRCLDELTLNEAGSQQVKAISSCAVALLLFGSAAGAGAETRTEQAKQAGIKAGPSPACELITSAEFAKITGRKANAAAEGTQLANGGSSCDFSGGNVTLFSGAQSSASYDKLLKAFKKDNTPREPVAGIGDRAYFMAPKPRDQYEGQYGVLVVSRGQHTLAVALETEKAETPQSLQPKLIAVAKAAIARLP